MGPGYALVIFHKLVMIQLIASENIFLNVHLIESCAKFFLIKSILLRAMGFESEVPGSNLVSSRYDIDFHLEIYIELCFQVKIVLFRHCWWRN